MEDHLSPITNLEAQLQSEFRNVWNPVGESPGENLGWPSIGVRGDVVVVKDVHRVAWEHWRSVFPISEQDFSSWGMEL